MKKWHWIVLGLLTLVTLAMEFTVLSDHKKHWWNSIPAFYILWGFFSCVAIVYVSKWLGKLFIFKAEDYYER